MNNFNYLKTAMKNVMSNEGSIISKFSDGDGGFTIKGTYKSKSVEIRVSIYAFLDSVLNGYPVVPKYNIKYNDRVMIGNASIGSNDFPILLQLIKDFENKMMDKTQVQKDFDEFYPKG